MVISTSLAFSVWSPGTLLRVSGEDAATFLQGQFTNDLRGMSAGAGVYGLWLNHKGKVLADSFVLPGEEAGEFLAVSYFCPVAAVRARLEAYIIAEDVILEDITTAWAGVSLLGPGASDWLKEKPQAGRSFPGRRQVEENREWIFPSTVLAEVRAQLAGIREVDAAELATRRIHAEIPVVPADIGPGDLPGEGALESAAISYTKGCYLGQEVMARLKSMGQVRRRLRRVRGTGPLPTLPATLWQGGQRVGDLRSASAVAGGYEGLAMISLVTFKAGAGLALAAGASETAAVIAAEP